MFKETGNQHNCAADLLKIMKSTLFNQYVCFGNHDHYCFSRKELKQLYLDNYSLKNNGENSL